MKTWVYKVKRRERKTMILYYVANKYDYFVCGPFRHVEVAETWAKRYSNNFWGKCHVVIKSRKVEDE